MKKDNQIAFLEVHLPSQLINQLPAKVSTTVRRKESTQDSLENVFNASSCLFNAYECLMCMHIYTEER